MYIGPKILVMKVPSVSIQVYNRIHNIKEPYSLLRIVFNFLFTSWYVYTAMEDGCPHAEFNALSRRSKLYIPSSLDTDLIIR